MFSAGHHFEVREVERMGLVNRVLADGTQLGGALGRYAVKELKAPEIAVIDDDSAYGHGIAEEFSKAVNVDGGSIALAQHSDPTAAEFTEMLTTVRD